ncbi:MAG: reverse transcriptase N-terminal domain-containing protein [Gammaproteobacteria bacterium]
MTHTKWDDLNWAKIEDTIFIMQKQIYAAKKSNNIEKLRNIQNLLINSHEAKLLAVNKVTKVGTWKNTSSVYYKLPINDEDRYVLADQLVIDGTVSPLRRIYTSSIKKSEIIQLGIATIFDKCKQLLVKLAIEPELEYSFDPRSYGFRPVKTAIDAILAIRSYMIFRDQSVWVFNADICRSFDKIDHEVLMKKLSLGEPFNKQISLWLKSGLFEEGVAFSSFDNSPLGGVLSPLLANALLNEMQQILRNFIQSKFGTEVMKKTMFVRYGYHFIVLAPSEDVIIHTKFACETFLKSINLDIDQSRNQIISSLLECKNGKIISTPFDFLGFRFIQRYVSIHKEFASKSGFKTRFITRVIPAPSRIERHKASITRVLKSIGSVKAAIEILNPRIQAWCNYFRYSDSKLNTNIPKKLDLWMNAKMRKFIRRTTKRRGKACEFWKQNSKEWILYAKYIDEKTGNEVEITLKKYSSFKWSISDYPVLPLFFKVYELPSLKTLKRQIE